MLYARLGSYRSDREYVQLGTLSPMFEPVTKHRVVLESCNSPCSSMSLSYLSSASLIKTSYGTVGPKRGGSIASSRWLDIEHSELPSA